MSIARRKDRRSRRADVYVLGKTSARLWPNIEVIAEFAMTIVALAKAGKSSRPTTTSYISSCCIHPDINGCCILERALSSFCVVKEHETKTHSHLDGLGILVLALSTSGVDVCFLNTILVFLLGNSR